MPNLIPPADVESLCAQIEGACGIGRLRELLPPDAEAGPDMIRAILEEASKFNEAELSPVSAALDRAGCRLEGGRVRTAPEHRRAWKAYLDAGWLGIDQPLAAGGQALPLHMLAACQEIFDRGSVAFGMLPTAVRAAARLIDAHAEEAIRAEWLPQLVSGRWAATICISEPEAGSDAGRIRTLAEPCEDGRWRITGEKIWISYGDHDLAERIGHCLLARTPDAPPGGAGLSLFLVPDSVDGGRNAVAVRRIEEKLGLHASPTCALGFEGASGWMIGKPGRGLAQLFTMIAVMRLMVSVQGLATAAAAADVAFAYAEERRQGGPASAPPLPIAEHADVRRMLVGMASRVEVLRGLILTAAVQADLAALEPEGPARDEAQALTAWLLPIIKTLGAETGFDAASEAIQVLGGAGYVRDWPVEQLLRDARVLAIFEGTSGMQALDLLHRRLIRDQGRGLRAFLAAAGADIAASSEPEQAGKLQRVVHLLQEIAGDLGAANNADAAAYPFLKLAALAATGWIALRLLPAEGRLAAAGRAWLCDLEAAAGLEAARIASASERTEAFAHLRRRPG
jgi:alkylation response protein AidB-like acyl-CoA dehydrogenase